MGQTWIQGHVIGRTDKYSGDAVKGPYTPKTNEMLTKIQICLSLKRCGVDIEKASSSLFNGVHWAWAVHKGIALWW